MMKRRISVGGVLLLFVFLTGAVDSGGDKEFEVGKEFKDTVEVCIRCYNDSIGEIAERMRNDAAAFEKISRRIARNTRGIQDNNTMIRVILNDCGVDTLRERVPDTLRARRRIHVRKTEK
jgi:hypothetical protein